MRAALSSTYVSIVHQVVSNAKSDELRRELADLVLTEELAHKGYREINNGESAERRSPCREAGFQQASIQWGYADAPRHGRGWGLPAR